MADGWRKSLEVTTLVDRRRVLVTKRLELQPDEGSQMAERALTLIECNISIAAMMLGAPPLGEFRGWELGGVELFFQFDFAPRPAAADSAARIRLLCPSQSASPETPVSTLDHSQLRHDRATGDVNLPLALFLETLPVVTLALGKVLLESLGASTESADELRQLSVPSRFVVSSSCLKDILLELSDEIPEDLIHEALSGAERAEPSAGEIDDKTAPAFIGPPIPPIADEPKTAEVWYDFRNALQSGDFATAEELLQETPDLIRLTNSIGETALHFLAVENDLESLRWLTKRGANLDTKNDLGEPLIFAVALLGHQKLLFWCFDQGVDLQARDSDDQDLVEYLIEFDENHMAKMVRNSDAWKRAHQNP